MRNDCLYIVVSCCGKTDIFFVCENREDWKRNEVKERRLKFSQTRKDTCLNSPGVNPIREVWPLKWLDKSHIPWRWANSFIIYNLIKLTNYIGIYDLFINSWDSISFIGLTPVATHIHTCTTCNNKASSSGGSGWIQMQKKYFVKFFRTCFKCPLTTFGNFQFNGSEPLGPLKRILGATNHKKCRETLY